jgi:hypothetical protein
MIDVKEAVQKAILFVHDVVPDSRANSAFLEEVELSEDGAKWLVTVSVPSPKSSSLGSIMSGGSDRDYKLIRIDSTTGVVESLKIRKV